MLLFIKIRQFGIGAGFARKLNNLHNNPLNNLIAVTIFQQHIFIVIKQLIFRGNNGKKYLFIIEG